jgi:hypothetical protein
MPLSPFGSAVVRAAALATALVAASCAQLVPTASPEATAALAGQWIGWMTIGRIGYGPATMTLRPGGAFEGVVRLADGDAPFRGAVTALASGALRYGGTFGDGTVTLIASDARRTLRFVPDGGGGEPRFEQAR